MQKSRRYLAVCMLFLVAGLVPSRAALSATDKKEAFAYRAGCPIVVDGSLDEWNMMSPLILAEESQVIRDAPFWEGPLDLSAKIYVMWDETNLYLGADVTEDTPFRAAAGILPFDAQDSFDLYLSTSPEADPDRRSYESTDFRVILLIDNNYWDTAIDRTMVKAPKGLYSRGLDGGQSVLIGFKCAAQRTTLGFTYEAVIPWSNFANEEIPCFVPKPGDSIGFNFLITDTPYPCPGTEYIPQIAWTGDETLVVNPSVWGILTFK